MPGAVLVLSDGDDTRRGYTTRAAEQVDSVFGKPALLCRVVVVGDHEVAPGERLLDVDLARDRLARPGGSQRAGDGFAGSQQRLRGDARVVGALAGDQLALDDGHLEAALGQVGRAVLARGPGPYQDDVIVGAHRTPVCMAGSFVPCRA